MTKKKIDLKDIVELVDNGAERIKKFRREIHQNPELSGEERMTSALVAGVLEASDIEVTRNVGGHGVVGFLKGAKAGRTVALRADMDALPMQEKSEAEYKSCVDGVMHACGHDVHTAILLGVAITLANLRERLVGNVKFLFQPSEERGPSGATGIIESGALKDPDVDAICALHCFPEFSVGQIAHKQGVMTASADWIKIVVKGKSGHASRPHKSVDAVLIASLVINAIHHIVSRRTDPLHHAVISIGTIHGGDAENIIADRVEMKGTVRTFNEEVRRQMPDLIEETVRGVTHGFGGDYEFEYSFEIPSVVNDPEVDEVVASAARDILGPENVTAMRDPLMGAEDFSYYLAEVPGALFRLGTSNKEEGFTAMLHNASFDVDEDALAVGAKVMAWTAIKLLSR